MHKIDFNTLVARITEGKDRKTMLTFHSIGDTDSVASAMALSRAFANSRVVAPDLVTANALRLLAKTGHGGNPISSGFAEDAQQVIMLDVNDFAECGPFEQKLASFTGDIIIIDHHAETSIKNDNVYIFNDESYNSASSIVLEVLRALGIPVGQNDAKLLSMGIISDSADFRNADSLTFTQIGYLLGVLKTDYVSILREMERIPPPEIRAKTIRDIARASTFLHNDLLVMHGRAHQHANIAADDAIKLGADVALFYVESDKGVTFSARMHQGLDKRLGVHLGVLMKRNARLLEGSGGGHPCAAGAYGPNSGAIQEFINTFFQEVLKGRAVRDEDSNSI